MTAREYTATLVGQHSVGQALPILGTQEWSIGYALLELMLNNLGGMAAGNVDGTYPTQQIPPAPASWRCDDCRADTGPIPVATPLVIPTAPTMRRVYITDPAVTTAATWVQTWVDAMEGKT